MTAPYFDQAYFDPIYFHTQSSTDIAAPPAAGPVAVGFLYPQQHQSPVLDQDDDEMLTIMGEDL